MNFKELFQDKEFFTYDDHNIACVRFVAPYYMLAWEEELGRKDGWQGAKLKHFDLDDDQLSASILEGSKFWDGLSSLMKEELRGLENTRKCRKAPIETVEPALPASPAPVKRRGRKPNPLHEGIPKKLQCSVCKEYKATTPPQFLKQVEKSGLTREEFMAAYVCRSCRKKV